LLANEAFEVLALRPGASPAEIKEAYRDLVKVWHPDRFGSDARLRRKAEDKLKQINAAYRVLQADPGVGGGYAAGPERAASSTRGGEAAVRYSSSAPAAPNDRARSNSKAVGVGWIYGCLGLSLALLASYRVSEYGRSTSASVQPAARPQAAAEAPAAQTAGRVVAGHSVHSVGSAGTNVWPKDIGGSRQPGATQFQVRALSDPETARLEEACSRQKQLQEAVAYQACLKAQLDLMTNAPGRPDLSALNGAERESIESVCSGEKRLRGVDGYNLCLTAQMARWVTESARPELASLNLSGFRDADRSSIESACRRAKNREGPAAYDRCLVRWMKALAEAR
jgi:hypothetical protein